MANWVELENQLARAMRAHFEKWPDAWTLYCTRGDKHREWPELDFGERLHVLWFYQDEIIGDVSEIQEQWISPSRTSALQYLLGHVRCHVAGGPGYRATCGHCNPGFFVEKKTGERRRGSEFEYYELATQLTTPAQLEQLAQRIARAPAVAVGMTVRLMYARQNLRGTPPSADTGWSE